MGKGKRTVLNACVTDIEKRREPSKHYVYIVHVTWSDGSVNVVYRRYSSFFDFQVKLLAKFPDEAGANNPSSRCIPFLPGKKLFGRSHVREVALKRLKPLDEYCQQLVKLPSKLSDSPSVIDFFTPTPEDISPPAPDGESSVRKDIEAISEPIQAEQYLVVADYKKQQKNEVDLVAGDLVEVFEKNDNGWWFVTINDQHGWAPGTFLQNPDSAEEEEEVLLPGNDETFITNNAYKSQAEDEISFETGVIVNVLQKSLDGWWKISYQGKQGWAPATFLQIYKGPSGVTATPPTQNIGNVMLLSENKSRSKPTPGGPGAGGGSRPLPGLGLGSGGRSQPLPPAPSDADDSDQLYLNYDMPAESKPTPPRRSTVRTKEQTNQYNSQDGEREETGLRAILRKLRRTKSCSGVDEDTHRKSARRGATRPTKVKQKKVVEYYTTSDFQGAAGEGSLSFATGEKAELLEENDGGWWFMKIRGQEGWVPSTLIEKKEVSSGPSGGGGRFNGKSSLGSLDEETGEESGPPALPARPAFGSGDKGAFTPVGKSKPPPVDRSNSPSQTRKSSGGSAAGGNDFMAALKKQFENTSVNQQSAPQGGRPAPKPLKPVSQPYCNRDSLFITTATYENDENDGLSFGEGEKVEVIRRDDSGWWMVRLGSKEGWVPSTFLEKA